VFTSTTKHVLGHAACRGSLFLARIVYVASHVFWEERVRDLGGKTGFLFSPSYLLCQAHSRSDSRQDSCDRTSQRGRGGHFHSPSSTSSLRNATHGLPPTPSHLTSRADKCPFSCVHTWSPARPRRMATRVLLSLVLVFQCAFGADFHSVLASAKTSGGNVTLCQREHAGSQDLCRALAECFHQDQR